MAARPSPLFRTWFFDEVRGFSLCVPNSVRLETADAEWPSKRRDRDVHRHWSWVAIAARTREPIAVIDERGRTLALWASKRTVLRSPEGPYYRLDYLEVDGALRGGDFGGITFALLAAWTRYRGCDGIVLASLPESAKVYRALGAEERLLKGWKTPGNLVPFVVGPKLIAELEEIANDLER